jgi:hypothetical protein
MIFYSNPYYFAKKQYVIGGNGGHFWIQHLRKHKVYQKYSMQLKKKLFLQTCVINRPEGLIRQGRIRRRRRRRQR